MKRRVCLVLPGGGIKSKRDRCFGKSASLYIWAHNEGAESSCEDFSYELVLNELDCSHWLDSICYLDHNQGSPRWIGIYLGKPSLSAI